MSKTMNIANWLRAAWVVSLVAGSYLGGICIGDWRASTRASSERCADRDELLAMVGRQADRLAAIERAIAEARTIHVERGADGVLSVSVIRTDKSGYEVSGRTLDVLIGGAQ